MKHWQIHKLEENLLWSDNAQFEHLENTGKKTLNHNSK